MENRAVLAGTPHTHSSRGDPMQDKKAVGNVVAEYQIGSTRVKICDDYCRYRTKEEIEMILARIAKKALESFRAEGGIGNGF